MQSWISGSLFNDVHNLRVRCLFCLLIGIGLPKVFFPRSNHSNSRCQYQGNKLNLVFSVAFRKVRWRWLAQVSASSFVGNLMTLQSVFSVFGLFSTSSSVNQSFWISRISFCNQLISRFYSGSCDFRLKAFSNLLEEEKKKGELNFPQSLFILWWLACAIIIIFVPVIRSLKYNFLCYIRTRAVLLVYCVEIALSRHVLVLGRHVLPVEKWPGQKQSCLLHFCRL